MSTEFEKSVWQLLKRIPKGRVSTYSVIARALGKPLACRAVGNACNKNLLAPRVPCHRVVQSNGFVGGYSKSVKKKIALLAREGVNVKNNKVLEFKQRLFEF